MNRLLKIFVASTLVTSASTIQMMGDDKLLSDLVEIKTITLPALSPDGNLAVFSVIQASIASNNHAGRFCACGSRSVDA